jgi:acetyl esterase/lipase
VRQQRAGVELRVANRVAWQLYLGARYGGKDVPAYAAAARASDYHGLPPTCTFVGDLEPFRDETAALCRAAQSGRRSGRIRALSSGAYHGFDVIAPKAAISRRANAFLLGWFKQAAVQQLLCAAGSGRCSPRTRLIRCGRWCR